MNESVPHPESIIEQDVSVNANYLLKSDMNVSDSEQIVAKEEMADSFIQYGNYIFLASIRIYFLSFDSYVCNVLCWLH